MASKVDQKHDTATSSAQIDFAVKAIDASQAITVDGPVIDVSDSSSGSATPPCDLDSAIVSDEIALAPPSYSPQLANEDGILEDGEMPEDKVQRIEDVMRDSAAESQKVHLTAAIANDACTLNNEESATVTDPSKGHARNGESPATPQAIFEDSIAISRSAEAVMIALPASPVEDLQNPHEMRDMSNPTEIAEGTSIVSEDEEAVAEAPQQPSLERSIPPHTSLDVHPRQSVLQNPQVRHDNVEYSKSNQLQHSTASTLPTRYADFPRAPRQQTYQNSHNYYRSDGSGREEVTRLNALLMKTRNELEAERTKNANMRRMVESEKEKMMDAALSTMTTDLLNKQAETLARQEKVATKERELEYRQARIDQLEVYLSEGQKQVYRYNNGLEGGPSMIDINREHDRRQAELRAQKSVADVQASIKHQQLLFEQREAALQMREQQYKALIRSSFEVAMHNKAMLDMAARLAEVADVEYNSGFRAGKAVGRAEGAEEARQKGFLEGYGSCHRAQVTLSKMRQGLIPHDSPELDFVYDAAHSRNLFSMGARVGSADCKTEKTPSVSRTLLKEAPREKEQVVQKMAEEPIMQKSVQERVRKFAPPPRPTFASELRGAQNMHNGHFVLANGSGPSSPVAIPIVISGGRVVGDVDNGRQIIRYAQEDESNLIDLY